MKFKNSLTVFVFFLMLFAFLAGIFLWRQAFIDDAIIETSDILRIGGSTTIYPYARVAARSFMSQNKNKIVTVLESSTGGGISQLLAGQVDIANATRLPQNEELAAARAFGKNLVVHKIGYEAIALVVHPSKYPAVTALTRQQAKAIFFDGTITDWSQLNPSLSGPIHVYVRDLNVSGTAATFNEKVTGNAEAAYTERAIPTYLTPLIVETVKEDPNGIAYTPIIWVDHQVRAVGYGESPDALVTPAEQAIAAGDYALTSILYLVTLGEPTPLAKDYISYVLDNEGQSLLQQNGFFMRADKPKPCDYLSETVC